LIERQLIANYIERGMKGMEGKEETFNNLAEDAGCGGHGCMLLYRIEGESGVGERFEVKWMWGELEVGNRGVMRRG
jgi:hypothetical protein